MKGTCGVVLPCGGSYADSRAKSLYTGAVATAAICRIDADVSPPAVLGSRVVRRRKVLIGWGKQINKAGTLPWINNRTFAKEPCDSDRLE